MRGKAVLKRLLPVFYCLPLVGSLCAQNCVPAAKFQRTEPVPIRDISFSNDGLLDHERELEIVKLLRAETVRAPSPAKDMQSLADEAAERVRFAYQDEGYFEAMVTAKSVPFVADKSQYDIRVNIGPVGKQYRLGGIDIVRAGAFPSQQLLDLFPIEPGEIFSREKIVKGLDAVKHLYGSEGYINYAGVPDAQVDDDAAAINLTIDVDEGKQFRLRRVEVLGLDFEAKAQVSDELELKPGDVYDQGWLEHTVAKFQNLVRYPAPHGGAEMDEGGGFVDVVLDFRKVITCPPRGALTP